MLQGKDLRWPTIVSDAEENKKSFQWRASFQSHIEDCEQHIISETNDLFRCGVWENLFLFDHINDTGKIRLGPTWPDYGALRNTT